MEYPYNDDEYYSRSPSPTPSPSVSTSTYNTPDARYAHLYPSDYFHPHPKQYNPSHLAQYHQAPQALADEHNMNTLLLTQEFDIAAAEASTVHANSMPSSIHTASDSQEPPLPRVVSKPGEPYHYHVQQPPAESNYPPWSHFLPPIASTDTWTLPYAPSPAESYIISSWLATYDSPAIDPDVIQPSFDNPNRNDEFIESHLLPYRIFAHHTIKQDLQSIMR